MRFICFIPVRAPAFFLACCLVLPAPASALRNEQPVHSGLESEIAAGLEAGGRTAGKIAGIPWDNPDALADRVLEALAEKLSHRAALPPELSLSKVHLVELLDVEVPALYAAEDRRPKLLDQINGSLAKHLPEHAALWNKGLRRVHVEAGGGKVYAALRGNGIRWDQPAVVAEHLLTALSDLKADLPKEIFLSEKQASNLLRRSSVFRKGREQDPDFVFKVNGALQTRRQTLDLFREREVFIVRGHNQFVNQIAVPRQAGHRQILAWDEPESLALWVLNRLDTVEQLPKQIFLTQWDLAKIFGVTRATVSIYFIHHPESRGELAQALEEEFGRHPLRERKGLEILRLAEPFTRPAVSRTALSAQPTAGLEAISRQLGPPDALLDEITAAGLEQVFEQQHAA